MMDYVGVPSLDSMNVKKLSIPVSLLVLLGSLLPFELPLLELELEFLLKFEISFI